MRDGTALWVQQHASGESSVRVVRLTHMAHLAAVVLGFRIRLSDKGPLGRAGFSQSKDERTENCGWPRHHAKPLSKWGWCKNRVGAGGGPARALVGAGGNRDRPCVIMAAFWLRIWPQPPSTHSPQSKSKWRRGAGHPAGRKQRGGRKERAPYGRGSRGGRALVLVLPWRRVPCRSKITNQWRLVQGALILDCHFHLDPLV